MPIGVSLCNWPWIKWQAGMKFGGDGVPQIRPNGGAALIAWSLHCGVEHHSVYILSISKYQLESANLLGLQ